MTTNSTTLPYNRFECKKCKECKSIYSFAYFHNFKNKRFYGIIDRCTTCHQSNNSCVSHYLSDPITEGDMKQISNNKKNFCTKCYCVKGINDFKKKNGDITNTCNGCDHLNAHQELKKEMEKKKQEKRENSSLKSNNCTKKIFIKRKNN